MDDRYCLTRTLTEKGWVVRDLESCSSARNENDCSEEAPLAEATPGLIDMEKYGNDATLFSRRNWGHEG